MHFLLTHHSLPCVCSGSRHALYRLPAGGKPSGICVFIHGCKHDPESWFYKSKKCSDCTGAAGGGEQRWSVRVSE